MSFIARWKGKNVKVNSTNPQGLGVCDDSGFDFNHCDLVKQMEWRGNNLVWTGLMIGKPYLDKPSQQNRPPIVKDDPRAIRDARISSNYSSVREVDSHAKLLEKLNNEKWLESNE